MSFSSVVIGRFLEMLGSREVSVDEIWPCVQFRTESPITRYATTTSLSLSQLEDNATCKQRNL